MSDIASTSFKRTPLSAPAWVWLLYANVVFWLGLISTQGAFTAFLCCLFVAGFSFQFWTFATWRGIRRAQDPTTTKPYLNGLATAQADVLLLEDVLGSVRLYINWHYVTKQLTTEEKERFADAVESWSARLNDDIYGEGEDAMIAERWWR